MKLDAGVWTLHICSVTHVTRLMSVPEFGESVSLVGSTISYATKMYYVTQNNIFFYEM